MRKMHCGPWEISFTCSRRWGISDAEDCYLLEFVIVFIHGGPAYNSGALNFFGWRVSWTHEIGSRHSLQLAVEESQGEFRLKAETCVVWVFNQLSSTEQEAAATKIQVIPAIASSTSWTHSLWSQARTAYFGFLVCFCTLQFFSKTVAETILHPHKKYPWSLGVVNSDGDTFFIPQSTIHPS